MPGWVAEERIFALHICISEFGADSKIPRTYEPHTQFPYLYQKPTTRVKVVSAALSAQFVIEADARRKSASCHEALVRAKDNDCKPPTRV
jgi:hypothetical protein